MSWFIEGKISNCALDTTKKQISFRIKATNDYQIKTEAGPINVFVDVPQSPSNALLIGQEEEFKAESDYLPFFASCKDNIMCFKIKDKKGKKLESIAVKWA